MSSDLTSRYEIVPYRPEHKDAVVDLWSSVFVTDPFDRRSYFEWKYERNPYLPEPILFLALDGNGQVVGTRGFHGSVWQSLDASLVLPCAEDFAIAPDHQDSGLATELMRVALDDLTQRGYEYVLSASAGQTTVLHSLVMGWKSIGAMEPVGRVASQGHLRRGLDLASRRARKLWRPRGFSRVINRKLYGSPFEQLDRVAQRHPVGRQAPIVVERSPDPAALAELAARLPHDGRIRHIRDQAFFEWRYANPAREYRFLLSQCSGRVDGYMALARSNPLAVQISDWDGTSHEVRAQLLEFALSRGGLAGIGAWTASLPHRSKELLEHSGFQPTEMDRRARGMPSVLLKKLGGNGDWAIAGLPAREPSSWDIRLIDSMHG